MVDLEYLRTHYDSLDDEELDRLAKSDLVPEARTILEAEMRRRGMPLTSATETASPAGRGLYAPPKAVVADPSGLAIVTVSGLIRLFQCMVAAATLIGFFLFVWPFLPIPIADEVAALRAGAGGLAISPALSWVISAVVQPLWIVSAFGLCFFKWWARPLFAATYVLSLIGHLLGGVTVWLSWEVVLVTIATLLDGAVLALAVLPPLSIYFAADRR